MVVQVLSNIVRCSISINLYKFHINFQRVSIHQIENDNKKGVKTVNPSNVATCRMPVSSPLRAQKIEECLG